MTAIWKVYSVIRFEVLLEKLARMATAESPLSALCTTNAMVTEVLETTRLLEVWRLDPSSGSAEVKFQSSSADAPLLAGCESGTGWLGATEGFWDANSNKEGGGEGTGA